jgi:hypothetical protein
VRSLCCLSLFHSIIATQRLSEYNLAATNIQASIKELLDETCSPSRIRGKQAISSSWNFLFILSFLGVTVDGVRIGNWIPWAFLHINSLLHFATGASCSIMVKELCYKSEGREFRIV